ncbi:DEAD-box ATP-dependent RNA helicase 38 [Apostasia shenzhenica]|uniref:RNA helicase n=1 Tax=Apostasia shenzhenica TaxID=1088818 RepID=A0A2I0BA30_9ASPA|nr:DEAD-box ATP-dependent RNA helicase 38 [Apostasia shenzhenica]
MADDSSSSAATKTEEKRSWADEESEEETISTANPPPDGNEDSERLDLKKIEVLSITEDKGKDKDDVKDVDKDGGVGLLDNPDDSDIKAVPSGDTVYSSALRFEDLNLSKELLKGIYVEMRFQRPSKIQGISLPMILTPPYKDLVAQAHNGSGKTTCFVLGMLSRVDPNKKLPQAMCICPTRELAQQNQDVFLKMGKYTGITSFLAIPADSANYVPVSKLPPVTDQVVIGTPGTIKKWTSARKLGTRGIKILVFDEADHMLAEDGFRDDSLRIMKEIQGSSIAGCQVLLFSATFNDAVKEFVSRVVKDANQIFVKKEELTLDKVKQYKVQCPDELAKIDVIKDKIFEFGQKVGQTIIFVHTRNSARMLHQTLSQDGFECTAVQGALKQGDRDKIIKEFKDGITKVLITTDLLARGFDQSQVNLVINFDLPVKYDFRSEPDYEVYLHRIGRTGRFGRKGAAFNLLCTDRDRILMEKIERHFNHTIPEVPNWRSEEDFEKALKDAGLL